jgi:hypothetical protein
MFGAISAAILIGMGPQIYDALGSKGESLQEALSYSTDAEQVVLAASGYLYVTRFVYSFMAVR